MPMRGMVGVAKAVGEQRKDTVIVTMAIGQGRSCSPEAVDGPDRAMVSAPRKARVLSEEHTFQMYHCACYVVSDVNQQ